MFSSRVSLCAVLIALIGRLEPACAEPMFFYEDTPYLSVDDVPDGFWGEGVAYLEDFEDFDPYDQGLNFDRGNTLPSAEYDEIGFFDLFTDSVEPGTPPDAEGHIAGVSFFELDSKEITITFPQIVTSAGLVWTDGPVTLQEVIFEAFDGAGVSLGTISSGADISDDSFFATRDEDRFFGVRDENGISAVTISAITNSNGIEIDHIHWQSVAAGIAGDVNGDGIVDSSDAGFIFANWGTSPPGDPAADLNGDGLIDAADASVLFVNWTGDVAAVPEPGSIGVVSLWGLLALMARGRWLASRRR